MDSDLTPEQRQERELAATMAALKALGTGAVVPARNTETMDAAVAKLPGRGEWIKAAPGVAFICATLVILTFVTLLTVLTITGESTADFFRLINLFFNAFTAFGTMGLVAVALIHARRTMVNRRIAERGQEDAHRAADKADTAATEASSAARAVNGGLEARMATVLTPIVQESVQRAVAEALRDQTPCRHDEEGGPNAVRG